MKTVPLDEARARLTTLFDQALAGEPQRVVRDGTDAGVIVSESQWADRTGSGRTLADLMVDTLGSGPPAIEGELGDRSWHAETRELGSTITD